MTEQMQEEEVAIFDLWFIDMIYEWIYFIKKHFPEIQAESLIYFAINRFKSSGDINRKQSKAMWARMFLKELMFALGV